MRKERSQTDTGIGDVLIKRFWKTRRPVLLGEATELLSGRTWTDLGQKPCRMPWSKMESICLGLELNKYSDQGKAESVQPVYDTKAHGSRRIYATMN